MAFRFLDLVAELRNRIYYFAAVGNDKPTRLTKMGLHDDTYAGLTMVNKQIRAEYRPIQRREAKIEVVWEELEAFMDTFLGNTEDKASPPQLLRVLTKGYNKYDMSENVVDLMPLLQIKVLVLQFRCEFATLPLLPQHEFSWESARQHAVYRNGRIESEMETINELINHNNAQWMKDIKSGKIQSIVVELSTKMRIYFAPGQEPVGLTREIVGLGVRTSISVDTKRAWGFDPESTLGCSHRLQLKVGPKHGNGLGKW